MIYQVLWEISFPLYSISTYLEYIHLQVRAIYRYIYTHMYALYVHIYIYRYTRVCAYVIKIKYILKKEIMKVSNYV